MLKLSTRRTTTFGTTVSCTLVSLALAVPTAAAHPLAVHAAPDAAASTTDDDAAARLRGAASQAFSDGRYEDAIRGFQTAYDQTGEPTDLFNLGRIHEEIGDLPAALGYYEQFVKQPHLELDERRLAADRIEVLRVLVPEEAPPSEPEPEARAADPVRDERAAPTRTMLITGGALLAIGVGAAAAGGLVFGVRGRRARETIDGLRDGQNADRLTLSEAEDLDARGRNSDVLQATFLATGGAAALVGATLLTLGLVRRKQSRASVQAQLSRRQAFVSTTWRF